MHRSGHFFIWYILCVKPFQFRRNCTIIRACIDHYTTTKKKYNLSTIFWRRWCWTFFSLSTKILLNGKLSILLNYLLLKCVLLGKLTQLTYLRLFLFFIFIHFHFSSFNHSANRSGRDTIYIYWTIFLFAIQQSKISMNTLHYSRYSRLFKVSLRYIWRDHPFYLGIFVQSKAFRWTLNFISILNTMVSLTYFEKTDICQMLFKYLECFLWKTYTYILLRLWTTISRPFNRLSNIKQQKTNDR